MESKGVHSHGQHGRPQPQLLRRGGNQLRPHERRPRPAHPGADGLQGLRGAGRHRGHRRGGGRGGAGEQPHHPGRHQGHPHGDPLPEGERLGERRRHPARDHRGPRRRPLEGRPLGGRGEGPHARAPQLEHRGHGRREVQQAVRPRQAGPEGLLRGHRRGRPRRRHPDAHARPLRRRRRRLISWPLLSRLLAAGAAEIYKSYKLNSALRREDITTTETTIPRSGKIYKIP